MHFIKLVGYLVEDFASDARPWLQWQRVRRLEVLQHYLGLLVHQGLQTLRHTQLVVFRGLDWALEATKRFENRQKLPRWIPYADARVVIGVNTRSLSLLLLSEKVRVAKPGHLDALTAVGLVLLHDQTVVVLVELWDLLSLELFLRNWVLGWLEERSAGRHDSLKLDLTACELFTCLNEVLKRERGGAWVSSIAHRGILNTVEPDLVLQLVHCAHVPFKACNQVLRCRRQRYQNEARDPFVWLTEYLVRQCFYLPIADFNEVQTCYRVGLCLWESLLNFLDKDLSIRWFCFF